MNKKFIFGKIKYFENLFGFKNIKFLIWVIILIKFN